jgi:flagella basal body P-ring formation protein FlgA
MMVRKFFRFFGIAAAIFGAAPAGAVNTAVLQRSVDHFMSGYTDKLLSRYGKNARIQYNVTGLDSRLNLPDCPVPLTVEAREQSQLSARLNLQLGCPQGNGWSIYVPVDLSVRMPVVIAVRPVAYGQPIGAGDVRLGEADIANLYGQYLTELDAAIGMSAKRSIAQGSVIQTQQLDAPLLVRRGEAVVIRAESGVVSVKMTGVAMTDGRRGEQIRIKNKATSRVVEARVVAPGQAVVSM